MTTFLINKLEPQLAISDSWGNQTFSMNCLFWLNQFITDNVSIRYIQFVKKNKPCYLVWFIHTSEE